MCLAAAVVHGCAGPLRLRAHSFQNAALKLCDANGCRRGYVDGFMPDSTTTSCARVARRFVRVRRRLRRGHGFPLVRQRTRIARAWPSRDRPDGKASLALESCSLTVAAYRIRQSRVEAKTLSSIGIPRSARPSGSIDQQPNMSGYPEIEILAGFHRRVTLTF